ncbi:tetratricopeptide repeat protein [Nocardiopsis sp. FIRDI 009]|uniref:tetratricopeptide repeat protein n=1 Tax=Nocardiopsis sp. FIRDI 009 TaxID=714197 RepID=UPI001E350755|nr:tetratricopeptide repeat protein [Nocardiopsis sp. FIRDI 009]
MDSAPDTHRSGPSLPSTSNRLEGDVHGISVQARTVHGGVHITAPPPPAPANPRQLPPSPAVYLPRPGLVEAIDTAVSSAHADGRCALVVVTGSAGVGKSALATHYLRTHPELGARGQLFVDLRGFLPGPPADPHDVLESLLLSMGVDLRSVPADLSARSGWWRSVTADARVCLLLDDALSAAQVRALLPGGEHATVLVTTRVRLAGLRMDGAAFVDVPPLAPDDGVELLTRLSGRSPSGEDERAAIRRVADLCGGLPVAMCAVAVGESVHREQSWARVEHGLQDSEVRLHRLSEASRRIGEDTSVRGAFDLSVTALDADHARMYRRLAWHPGRDITARIAARLASVPEEDAEVLLDDLARQHLLSEGAHGRYRFHDLLRLHAAEKARAQEDPEERLAAVERLLSDFASLSAAADAALRPYAGAASSDDPVFTDPAEAITWLDDERETLASLAAYANENGHQAHALRLVEGLWPLFLHRGYASLWLRATAPAIAAARALGDTRSEGRMLNKRARGHRQLGDADAALADLTRAEAVWRELGDTARIALTRQQRGALALRSGRVREAIDLLTDTLTLDERTGDEHNLAITLLLLGRAHLADGDADQALPHLERGLPLLEEDGYNQARIRVALGSALGALGRPGRARNELDRALTAMRAWNSVSGESEALEALGGLAEDRGDTEEARRSYERARDLLPAADPARSRIERRLAGLDRV